RPSARRLRSLYSAIHTARPLRVSIQVHRCDVQQRLGRRLLRADPDDLAPTISRDSGCHRGEGDRRGCVNIGWYVIRRLLLIPPMLVGITLLSFIVSHAVPADPVTANLGDQAAANPEIVAAFKHRWGLDRPLPEQYGIYLWRVIHGDFGVSISTRQPVAVDLRQHLPPTIELALAA